MISSLSIVIPVYIDNPYRLRLFQRCCRSLAKTHLPEGLTVRWLLCDDCSPLDWQSCLQELSNIQPEVRRRSQSLGANGNCSQTITDGLSLSPYTISIELDMIVHPDWLVQLLQLQQQHPEAVAWTCFNAKYHPVTRHLPDGSLQKKSLSGNLLMVSRDTWITPAIIPEEIRAECGHVTWDWSFLDRAGVLSGKATVFCTSPSYAQHLGMVGYSFHWGQLDYDRALDFVAEQWYERLLLWQAWIAFNEPDISPMLKVKLLLDLPKSLLKRVLRRFLPL